MDEHPETSTDKIEDNQMEFTDQREELVEFLRSRLIECGWRDQIANSCRNLIQKYGVEQVKLSQIINEVRVEARQKVPEEVRTEVLKRLRLMQQTTADSKPPQIASEPPRLLD